MVFKPGVVANPNGRPTGSRNKRTEEIFLQLKERGDKHPAEILSSFASNESLAPDLRATCANMLLPYMVSKKGASPAARFVDQEIQVPAFQSVEEAQDFLAQLSQRAGAGELELQSALDISTLVRNWIISKQNSYELDIKAANAAPSGDTTIRITGGLPQLPGTEIIMPEQLNGHPVIDHDPVVPSISDHAPNDSVQDQAPPSDTPPEHQP